MPTEEAAILEYLEELDDICSFDAAVLGNDEVILFTQAIAEIEQKRGSSG